MSAGSSNGMKCPPLPGSLQCRMSVQARSAISRGKLACEGSVLRVNAAGTVMSGRGLLWLEVEVRAGTTSRSLPLAQYRVMIVSRVSRSKRLLQIPVVVAPVPVFVDEPGGQSRPGSRSAPPRWCLAGCP